MKKLKHLSANQFLCLLLAFWTILNLLQAAFTDISGDEAYYWVISKSLSWGYYDHPPFFAWLINPSVTIFGDTALGVRLFSVLCQPIYLYLFWTLLSHFKPTKKGAFIYFMIAFATPLLQLYGFVITPDTPLLLTTALVLWSYRRFLDSNHGWNQRAILDTILLGVSIALMGYAKYHGALIVALILLSNIRLLINPKTYIVAAIAALLYIPHLIWQMDHNWASFAYHLSGRMSGFNVENVWVFILNTIATFNPFWIPIFLIFAWPNRRKPIDNEQRFEQTLKYLTWGFMVFFLYSTRNVHVQPQWIIPLCFPMLYFIVKAASTRVKLTSYIVKVSSVFFFLLLAVRVFVMTYTGDMINADIFNSEKQYDALAERIDHRPLITNGTYMVASKIRFYTGNQSYAKPNVYNRTSHYQYIDSESDLYHKPIAIEMSDSAWIKSTRAEREARFMQQKVWHYELNLDTISNFVPVRNVVVSADLPQKVISGQTIALDLKIDNPYSWAIPLVGDDKYEIFFHLRCERFTFFQVPIAINFKEIQPYAKLTIPVNLEIPTYIPTNSYKAGFIMVRYPYTPWYNSEPVKMQIVNPKNRQ